MHDETALLEALSRFAQVIASEHDVQVGAAELMTSATAVLQLSGSAVEIVEDGHLSVLTAVSDASTELERLQVEREAGPCVTACSERQTVLVPDLRCEARWPEYAEAAARWGVVAVAGIPMRLGDEVIGAVNLYSDRDRCWDDDDVSVATVLADMATAYVVNACTHQQRERLTEQLQHALDSRVVIEQAKGVIARDCGVTVDEAYRLLRRHARSRQADLRAVAEAVVELGLHVER